MKYAYKPKSNYEKFGIKIYNLLVENFPQTFFVGGMVRDLLLNKKIIDIDISTSALPNEVAFLLNKNKIKYSDIYKKFGTILAISNNFKIEITSFRKELYFSSRYPKIKFVKNLKSDAFRRDFTINSLYLSVKNKEIIDPFKGIEDIKLKRLCLIGNKIKKISNDPLRIIRALRLALHLNFKLEESSWLLIKNNLFLINTITHKKINTEINKLKKLKNKILLKKIIYEEKSLDSVNKKFYY